MNKEYDYQEIVFSVGEYDGDFSKMWDDIGQFIRIVINDGYQCKVCDDSGPDIVIVQFDYIDDGISQGDLRWCTWDECECLELAHDSSDN
jgi:hypothetical protein